MENKNAFISVLLITLSSCGNNLINQEKNSKDFNGSSSFICQHKYVENVVKKPSIIENGLIEYRCEKCDDSYQKEIYDLSQYTFEDGYFVYDGNAHDLTIKGMIPYGTTVEYENNIAPGTGNVILRFMGNYEGIMTIPFAIFPPHQEEKEVSEPSVPVLENLSALSADKIRLGETVQIRTAAQGGTAPYTYSVFLCKIKKQNWKTVQENSENTLINITPAMATRYLILIKVKDSSGKSAKQYFKLSVDLPEAEADSPSS